MGLFDFLRRRDTEEVTPPIDDVLLRAILKGEVIDREKALTIPSVSGAVDFISSMVAAMPVKLYKYKQGKIVLQDDDPRMRLLNGDTGDKLNAYQMKKAMVEDYLLGQGGYAYIKKQKNEVVGLFYVEDRFVTILPNFKPIYKDFDIEVMGRRFYPWNFLKLLRNTKNGGSGTGLTEEVGKALETAYQTLLYQLSLVSSGGSKKGFLKAQRKLGQDEIDALKRAWRNLYETNSENVVVLNNGVEFQEASSSSVEMQLNESKRTLDDEIRDIFHIHPNDFTQTFKEAIYPVVKAFESAMNKDLLLEEEKGKYFFEMDVKEIVKANINERYQAYKLAKETGFMTLNEIRRAENMEDVEGLDVINVGLGAVLYDTNKHRYYTPNTDTFSQPMDDRTDEHVEQLIEDKEIDTAFEESGNSAEG